MFPRLGATVSRYWLPVLAAWALAAVGLDLVAPRWQDVTQDGDFAYLPAEMTSVFGQRLLDDGFPGSSSKSQVVIVAARSEGKLWGADYETLDRLVERFTPPDDGSPWPDAFAPIVSVWDYRSEVIGNKLVSPLGYEGQAALVMLHLNTEFMAVGNMPLLAGVYDVLDEIRSSSDFPAGLELGVTGSAAIGTDMLFAAEESIRNTELATVLLVVVILMVVYRAPGLIAIPLVTIAVSFWVAMDLLALLAQWSEHLAWLDFKVFKTTKIFVIVILFGAGTDYCLFLISRYREELQRGTEPRRAVGASLGGVGDALAASALTTVVGLGTMILADFGKFRNGGPAIALCVLVTLAACVTLTPALLRAGGRAVFWPFGVGSRRDESESDAGSLGERFWDRAARAILARPGLILVVAVLALAVPAVRGYDPPITYDLLSELGPERPSVRGTQILRRHFLAGATGPVTVLALSAEENLAEAQREDRIARLTRFLYELEYAEADGRRVRPILSVRSLTEPLGDPPGSFNPLSPAGRRKMAVLKHPRTVATFVSPEPRYAGRLARFDLIFGYDPFSQESVDLLSYVESQLERLADGRLDTWPEGMPSDWRDTLSAGWREATFDFAGTTAGIRDLERVTRSDQRRIRQLVVIAVLAVLIAILRRPWVCIYLVLSVLLGYFVTIGATATLFEWLHGSTFRGLDWKVPIFLFVLLVALGADYNIYLATRVFEEQRRFGPREGLRVAVRQTGGIITSCGIIMAGTFASMLTGTLRAMQQLGFALALGVLLDTLVIRTVLVPAFLALWCRAGSGTGPGEPVIDTPRHNEPPTGKDDQAELPRQSVGAKAPLPGRA